MEEKATTIEERFMNEQEICKGERIDTDPMHLGIVKIKDTPAETIGVLKIGRKTLEFHIVGGLGCYVLLYDGCTIKYINKKLKLKEWKTHKKMVTDLDIKFFETLDQAYTNGVYLTINEIYNDIILYVYEDIETVKLKNGIVPTRFLKEDEEMSNLENDIIYTSILCGIAYNDYMLTCVDDYLNYNRYAVIFEMRRDTFVSVTYNNGWTVYLYILKDYKGYVPKDIAGDIYTVFNDGKICTFDEEHTGDQIKRFSTPEEAIDLIEDAYYKDAIDYCYEHDTTECITRRASKHDNYRIDHLMADAKDNTMFDEITGMVKVNDDLCFFVLSPIEKIRFSVVDKYFWKVTLEQDEYLYDLVEGATFKEQVEIESINELILFDTIDEAYNFLMDVFPNFRPKE